MPSWSLRPLPALDDNYIWLLVSPAGDALVVDPGEAAPVLRAVADEGLRPRGILLTHHHGDHIGGVEALLERFDVPCVAPHDPRIPRASRRVGAGDRAAFDAPDVAFEVIEVPGHTRSHVAYHAPGVLFCGDTLFSLGCGRLFEGSAPQMLASLDRLAALPDHTAVCAAHEYTQSNAVFARAVDPDNPRLAERAAQVDAQRARGLPTLPTRLADERACNPFLRVDAPAVIAALARHLGQAPAGRAERFAALRAWKDGFRA
ncbi:hydroxyacylglutathione hydrolase [Coralloluteibacterium thermophilus]|uniref:Hydroxyacylglutathione hydrolase n=1 Tax=Coralloluteibacterium thermophilum TaxID=2707049 RepID=A0ABV9NJ12_9GAMM